MSTTQTGGNITSGFIDLATFDELEKYQYGGDDAITYFVRETRKASWFTQVPVTLVNSSGSAAFGQSWSVNVSRAGDYMLYNWLRVQVDAVDLATPDGANANLGLHWCRNLGHNLISECYLSFNDLVEVRFDNYHLDFWSAFTVPASKQNAYKNMIGDVADATNPGSLVSSAFASRRHIPSMTLNIPLPFSHSRDSGVALPTAALPYNEMRIHFVFRNYTDLLLVSGVEDLSTPANGNGGCRNAVAADVVTAPTISSAQVWANYAIVSNSERQLMGQNPRDILIEQVQTVGPTSFTPANATAYDLRLSHAVKALFFGVRNTTVSNNWSNYTTAGPYMDGGYDLALVGDMGGDPISKVSLSYESSLRLSNMDADYFALVNPFYHAVAVPEETGYHLYSYALDLASVDPMGSTNYGKLTNVSITVTGSAAAIAVSKAAPERLISYTNAGSDAAGVNNTLAGSDGLRTLHSTLASSTNVATAQTFSFILTAINHNVIRVSGGALGFPVL
jgi:hypothetical protein